MRNPLRVLPILFARGYVRVRRQTARVPSLYRVYRRSPMLQKLDAHLIEFLGAAPLIFSRAPRDIKIILRDIIHYLNRKQYRDALYRAAALIENNGTLGGGQLHALMAGCETLKSWELYDRLFSAQWENLARDAKEDNSRLIKSDRQSALEEAALILIRNARIDSALHILALAESIRSRPRYRLLSALLKFMQTQEREVAARAHAIRADRGNGEINLVGSIVWGEKYLDAFLRYNVRSMLAPGNMPHLRSRGMLLHAIVTTEAGRDYVRAHPVYAQLTQVAQVEFFCFPENLLELFKGEDGPDKWSYMLYGILDHINLFFARGLRANLFLIPVDAIVANPSFTHMRRYLDEGYDCCGGGNLVAERETFLPALDEACGTGGALTIGTHALATLALKFPHHYITSQLIHAGNKNFGKHARELFWPVEGGIHVHSIYTHPLATSARRLCTDYPMPYSWLDFLLAPRLFPEPKDFSRYKIIDNAEEAYINNFAPGARLYETTGRAFDPEDFAAAHIHSYPIHRYMLNTRQFIPCDLPQWAVQGGDAAADMLRVKQVLAEIFKEESVTSLPHAMHWDGCHLCGGMDLPEVIYLGDMPLSHQLRQSLEEKETLFPARFHYCNHCGLLQMRDPVPPDALYDADTYATGFQKPKHIDDLIATALSYHAPGAVLDVGCNDGSLLRSLEAHGFPLLAGIEPNIHASAVAERNSAYHIYTGYLEPEAARKIAAAHAGFDFIFVRHVLEHVTDLKSFFVSLNHLLNKDGLLVIELPRVENGFDAASPVILWEEHVNYFTVAGVSAMLRHYGYEIIDQRTYAFGGGSCAYIARRAKAMPLNAAAAKSLPLEYFQRYAESIEHLSQTIEDVVDQATDAGYAIVLYGAAPRSCILANYAKIGRKIQAVIDDRTSIQGRYMPGTDTRIMPLDQYTANAPVLALLGVGAENEHRVLARLAAQLGYTPLSVSLFPPRDIRESLKAAQAVILRQPESVSSVQPKRKSA